MRTNTEKSTQRKNLGQEREIEREDLSAWVVRGRWRGGRLGGGGGGGGGVIVSYRDKKLSIFLSFSAGHHDRRFVIAHHKPSDVVFFFVYYVVEIYRLSSNSYTAKNRTSQSVQSIERENEVPNLTWPSSSFLYNTILVFIISFLFFFAFSF